IDDTRAEMTDTLEAIGDRVSPGRVIERRRNRIVLWGRRARERVMGSREQMADRFSDAAGRLSDTAGTVGSAPSNLAQGVRDETRGAPLVAGSIAFGVGMLI